MRRRNPLRSTRQGISREAEGLTDGGSQARERAGATRENKSRRSESDTLTLFDTPYPTDERSRLSQDCTEPGWRGRVLPLRVASFSSRRPEICFPSLASRWVRKPDAYARAAGGVCGGSTRSFPADPWRVGKDGAHTHSPGGSGQGCTDGCPANGLETASR